MLVPLVGVLETQRRFRPELAGHGNAALRPQERRSEPRGLGVFAELLSRLPPPVAVRDGVNAERIDRGRILIHQHRCDVCHNPDLSGRENVPRIAGQREDYLLRVLRGYKNNTRPGYDASMGEYVPGKARCLPKNGRKSPVTASHMGSL